MTVVFVSFENPHAPVGGLAAVMDMLPPAVSKLVPTILVTPFFKNIKKSRLAVESGLVFPTGLEGRVFHNGKYHRIEILQENPRDEYPNHAMYLVRADEFFLAPENAYIDQGRENALFEDSHFLCKSVPAVLEQVAEKWGPPYLLDLQDWETALTVETIPGKMVHDCVITLHNPYDFKIPGHPRRATVLQLTIPRARAVSTVSVEFARELTADVLVRDVLANKLQGVFSLHPPVGINNGKFVKLDFPKNLATPEQIIKEKSRRRASFNESLQNNDVLMPRWGSRLDLFTGDPPLFLLFGRDDPRQKGFEVAAAAVYRFLEKKGPGTAKFIFAIVPGINGEDGLAYLEDLTMKYPGDVMIYVGRLKMAFDLLQGAASYIVMPSYYEPFGAAHEGYARGVPVIARATGGLLQQVRPANLDSLPPDARARLAFYHGDGTHAPTGYLYREHPSTETAMNWIYLLSTDFKARRPITAPVDLFNPVFWSMVDELERVLDLATNTWVNQKEEYCAMVTAGIALFETLTWAQAAREYIEFFSSCPSWSRQPRPCLINS